MIKINLRKGKLREVDSGDLRKLVEVSREESVRKNYFRNGGGDLEEYWSDRIEDQIYFRVHRELFRVAYDFLIEADGEIKGVVSLDVRPFSHNSPMELNFGEISYFILERYRRRGYASEAIKSLITFSFEKLNVGTIFAMIFPENEPSKKLLETVGFVEKNGNRYHEGKKLVRYEIEKV